MIIRKAVVGNFNDALKLVKNAGSSSAVHELLAKKGVLNAIVIEKIDNRAANILKQEAISVGASVALNENVSRFKKGVSDTVLFATTSQIDKLVNRFRLQPFRLKEIALKLENIVNKKKVFKYKERYLDLSNPVVMGIVNVDPNSFSGDGLTDPDEALKRAVEFERLGAGIIDIGAESSRPGTRLVNAKTEIKRLIPALKRIKKNVKIPVSIDTYKYETAKAALDEGADIINDIFALRRGKEISARLIADAKAGVILMHMKGIPKDMQTCPEYKNCTSEVYGFLARQKEYVVGFGIEEERIAVDPGPGFGKTVEHNVELIKSIGVFSTLGAVVGAVSRKKFVKALAGEDRTSFIAANFLAAVCGADIIRVHDVKETVKVLKIIETFRRI
jgi:dihydropteroate synthase